MRRFSVLSGELTRGFLDHMPAVLASNEHMSSFYHRNPRLGVSPFRTFGCKHAIRSFSSISLESTPPAASSDVAPKPSLGKVEELEKKYNAALEFYRSMVSAVTNLETELKNAKEEEKADIKEQLAQARKREDSALKDKEAALAALDEEKKSAPIIMLGEAFVSTLRDLNFLREDRSVIQPMSDALVDVPLRNRLDSLKEMFSILKTRHNALAVSKSTDKAFASHGVFPAASGMGKSRMLQVIGTLLPSFDENLIQQMLCNSSNHQEIIDGLPNLSHNQRAKLEALVDCCKGDHDTSFFRHMASCIGISVTFNHCTPIVEEEKQCPEAELIIHRLLWSHFCKPTVDFRQFVAALRFPVPPNLGSVLLFIRADFKESEDRHLVIIVDEVMLSKRDPIAMLYSTSHYMDNLGWVHFAWSSLSYNAIKRTPTDRAVKSIFLLRLSEDDAKAISNSHFGADYMNKLSPEHRCLLNAVIRSTGGHPRVLSTLLASFREVVAKIGFRVPDLWQIIINCQYLGQVAESYHTAASEVKEINIERALELCINPRMSPNKNEVETLAESGIFPFAQRVGGNRVIQRAMIPSVVSVLQGTYLFEQARIFFLLDSYDAPTADNFEQIGRTGLKLLFYTERESTDLNSILNLKALPKGSCNRTVSRSVRVPGKFTDMVLTSAMKKNDFAAGRLCHYYTGNIVAGSDAVFCFNDGYCLAVQFRSANTVENAGKSPINDEIVADSVFKTLAHHPWLLEKMRHGKADIVYFSSQKYAVQKKINVLSIGTLVCTKNKSSKEKKSKRSPIKTFEYQQGDEQIIANRIIVFDREQIAALSPFLFHHFTDVLKKKNQQ